MIIYESRWNWLLLSSSNKCFFFDLGDDKKTWCLKLRKPGSPTRHFKPTSFTDSSHLTEPFASKDNLEVTTGWLVLQIGDFIALMMIFESHKLYVSCCIPGCLFSWKFTMLLCNLREIIVNHKWVLETSTFEHSVLKASLDKLAEWRCSLQSAVTKSINDLAFSKWIYYYFNSLSSPRHVQDVTLWNGNSEFIEWDAKSSNTFLGSNIDLSFHLGLLKSGVNMQINFRTKQAPALLYPLETSSQTSICIFMGLQYCHREGKKSVLEATRQTRKERAKD